MGTTPLWIAARSLLRERLDDFFRRLERALKTFGPDDIHDLRVASRRLREGLALFAPCYPSRNIERLTRQVRRVTRLLGEIRNTDEALLFFAALAEELDAACRGNLERLLDSFRETRKSELKRLKAGLRRAGSGARADFCRRVVEAPALFAPPADDADPFVPLVAFARGALDARLAAVLELVPEARQPGAIESQHLLRIAVKHFRYRLEILSSLVGSRYQELHGALKGYQELLGRMHDLDVFAGIVREAGFPPETEQPALDAIAAKREGLFTGFSRMLETAPFERIGAQVRTSL
ncbi:MAG: CHAD domain-containing protein [Geobacteraceae bacterium]|nr:CHAD domain-containing protein [Geobacteraceae bacterium]